MISSHESTTGKSKEKNPNTVIVALELQRLDANFLNFKQSKTAEEKIDFLKNQIMNAYDAALSRFPQAGQIIIVFREYALTDQGDSKSISDKDKKYFKKVMQALAKTNNKLIIIAGGTLIEKTVPASKLTTLKKYYSGNEVVKTKIAELKKVGTQVKTQINMHEEHLIDTAKDKQLFTKIKNSSFVFFQSTINRHGKLAPSYEHYSYDMTTSSDGKAKSLVFQPGKGRNLSTIIPLENLTIGIEICREHFLGVLKDECASKNTKVDLQFILSDSIHVDSENLCASKGAIHVDSTRKAKIIVTNLAQQQNEDLVLFHFDILAKEPTLQGPIEPHYPLEFQVKNFIEEAKKSHASDKFVLTKIKELENLLCFPSSTELLIKDYSQIIIVALNRIYIDMYKDLPEYHNIESTSLANVNTIVVTIAHLLMKDACTTGQAYRHLIMFFKQEFREAYQRFLAGEEMKQMPKDEVKRLSKLDEQLRLELADGSDLEKIKNYLKEGANPHRAGEDNYSATDILHILNDSLDKAFIKSVNKLFEDYQYTPKIFPDDDKPKEKKQSPKF